MWCDACCVFLRVTRSQHARSLSTCPGYDRPLRDPTTPPPFSHIPGGRWQTQLEFKLKFRPLRVRILDHTSVFRVQDSYTVGEIIAYIAHEIGLANSEEYGLKPEAAADSFVDWYAPPGSAC